MLTYYGDKARSSAQGEHAKVAEDDDGFDLDDESDAADGDPPILHTVKASPPPPPSPLPRPA